MTIRNGPHPGLLIEGRFMYIGGGLGLLLIIVILILIFR
jgi:hypothetical protein